MLEKLKTSQISKRMILFIRKIISSNQSFQIVLLETNAVAPIGWLLFGFANLDFLSATFSKQLIYFPCDFSELLLLLPFPALLDPRPRRPRGGISPGLFHRVFPFLPPLGRFRSGWAWPRISLIRHVRQHKGWRWLEETLALIKIISYLVLRAVVGVACPCCGSSAGPLVRSVAPPPTRLSRP